MGWVYEPCEFGDSREEELVEVVIDLRKVIQAYSFKDFKSGGQTTVFEMDSENLEKATLIHVDLTLDQVEEILYKNAINPEQKFRTHGIKSTEPKKNLEKK